MRHDKIRKLEIETKPIYNKHQKSQMDPCDAMCQLRIVISSLRKLHQKRLANANISWWRGTVVERGSLAGELSLSCARPAADG